MGEEKGEVELVSVLFLALAPKKRKENGHQNGIHPRRIE